MSITIEEKVRQRIEEMFDEIVAIRRDFHSHPELSEQEERTAAKISQYLTEWGIPHQAGIAGHGVVGVIHGTANASKDSSASETAASAGNGSLKSYHAVGIRADIDALPITEKVAWEFASKNEGVMHACGHDIHAAMLLGTAKVLHSLKDEFSGAVKLFFQPAEETVGGAERMIQAGCMSDPDVDAVLSFHVAPYLPSGAIEFCRGKMNAATCDLQLEVEGISCHGAHPEGGVDAIVAASQIVTALQSIISRNLSPTNPGIITIGQFHAGTKDNIVAGTAHLSGTIRALDPTTMQTLKTRIRAICEQIAAAYGASVKINMIDGYPALINSTPLCLRMEALAEQLVGRDHIYIMEEPSLGADDFAFFTEACDGLYMNLGTNSGTEEKEQKIHNEYYHPDESSMKNGILMEAMGALTLLQ